MRIFVLLSLLAVVHADTSAPTDRWLRLCESRLRRAAHDYHPAASANERWDWQRGDATLQLRYHWIHGELDYQLSVAPTTQRSHSWRERLIRNPRFPELVDEWIASRAAGGHIATFRAAGMAGMMERDSFLASFRPALEACLATH